VSWKTIKAVIETVVLLDSLSLALGVGGVSALLLGIWASLLKMSSVHIALVMLGAFVLGVLLLNGVRAFLRGASRAPDYEAWDEVLELTIHQIASLWAERDPLLPHDSRAYAYFRALKENAQYDALPVISKNNGNIDGNATISRGDLIAFFEKRGERPKFLFPDAR
jgi:hypothetical protein